MKPDQLNRLIKVNRRMQPWFLRNTSELYESAIRTYYERGYSSHNQFPRLRTENVGPLRRIKKAEPEPSPADVYPRSHILQADQAASSSSGQLLHTMMQASRRRSMSFSAARPYATYGQSTAPRSSASSSCSSGRSSVGSSRTEILGGRAKRKRKSGRGGSRAETLKGNEEQLVDMGMLFGGRSMSLPPPLPSAPGLGCGAMMRTMPPSRQHHMAAMAKNSLAQPIRIPRGDGDHLMPVDAALKRRISVLGGQLEEGRGRARAELGHLMVTGNGSSIDGGRFPSEMRFRFQTLGDRIKQFEYIQFADGPVASYAFNRSHRGPSGGGSGSTRTRLESLPRDADVGLQPRHLSFNNVLHANYRQRSRSLEHANQLLEAIAPRPVTPVCPLGNGGSARGSSLDSSSRTSFQPSSSTATETNAENCGKSSEENLGYSKSSKETSVESFGTAWQGTPARDWYKYQGSSSTLGTTTTEATTVRNSNTYKGNRGSSSGPVSGSIPGAKPRSVKGCTAGETLGSSAVNSAPFRATSRASSKGTKKAASEAASGGFAGPISGSYSGSYSGSHSGSYSGSYSGSHSGSLSGSYAGQEEPSRATLAPVRRQQLQQRSLQTAPKVDDPTGGVKEHVKEKINEKVKEKVKERAKERGDEKVKEKVKERVKERVKGKVMDKVTKRKPLDKPMYKPMDKPRVTKVTNNQVSRSSRRAFLQTPEDPDLPAGNPPKTSHQDQKTGRKLKEAANLKGANQLLVASASQVSAYKRAFRTQQQMLKAEILHQQAQHLQQFRKNIPAEMPSSSKETTRLQSHRGSITTTTTNRSTNQRNAATSGGKAPPLKSGVSKTGTRTLAASTAKPKTNGSELRKKGPTGLPANAAAASVTATVTAPVTASITAPATAPLTTTLTAASKRTAQPTLQKGTKTTKKGSVAGVASAGGRVGGGGGAGWKAGPKAAQAAAKTETKTRRTVPTLAAQQQHSRNGNSLLGFRRENKTLSRAAAALLQRRDADEPLPQLQSQSPSASLSASQSQSAQQRRQFHLNPPWRPSY